MEAGRAWFLAIWRNPLGTLVLYGALLTHLTLALYAVYQRRTLRLPWWDLLRLGLGLSIPLMLAAHVVGTRVASSLFGVDDSYTRMVQIYWQARPEIGVKQAVMLLVAWTHATIGLHYWLRLRRWYRRAAPWLYVGAVLLPVLALLGFADAGRAITRLTADPEWLPRMQAGWRLPTPRERSMIDLLASGLWWGMVALIALVVVARAVRNVWQRRSRGVLRVTYAGRVIDVVVPIGTSVLEASRRAGIPHASVCGGRGRCSTCRVRVVVGRTHLPPPHAGETRVLRRIGAGDDVRLACQLRPTHDVTVLRLLPPAAGLDDALAPAMPLAGDEQEIAVFFADLRRFTSLAERKLPYDVVFFLNRYFETVGRTIEASGGITNQFTGDGVMALFGVGTSPADGCRRALHAARAVVDAVAGLSDSLATELPGPLRIGIGIHAGAAVVGRMGYGEAMYLTAVGDTVHVASRLQDLTKQYDCQLVITEHVAATAGIDASAFPRHRIEVRNRAESLAIRVVDDVRRLSLDDTPTRTAP